LGVGVTRIVGHVPHLPIQTKPIRFTFRNCRISAHLAGQSGAFFAIGSGRCRL
jgi:hypothetical protein